MMNNKWIVIGISGATCSGKTTIARKLNEILPRSQVLCQDTYFLPVDDERHVWISNLKHINFDIITSLDMDKMFSDVQEILSDAKAHNKLSKESSQFSNGQQSAVLEKLNSMNVNILILEGFCIFSCRPIERLCNLKYFFTLNEEECYNRRIKRVYEPPDCKGYFEQCAWPEYKKHLNHVWNKVKNIHYFDEFTKDPINKILNDLPQALECL